MGVMRGLHLAGAPILSDIAGLGEIIVPLFSLGNEGFLGSLGFFRISHSDGFFGIWSEISTSRP